MTDRTTYEVGDTPKLQVTFTVDDVATDPTTVTFDLIKPDGTTVQYVYGTDIELVKDSTGVYYVLYTIDMESVSGRPFRWRMVGTGTCPAAYRAEIIVADDAFS